MKSNVSSFQHYPLKIIEMNEFFLSKDKDLIVGKNETISKSHDAYNQMRSKHDPGAQAEFKWMRLGQRVCDRYLASSESRMNLAGSNQDGRRPNQEKPGSNPNKATPASCDPQISVLFVDSAKYRQYFEKSHLKLKNNMIVLDSQLCLNSEANARKLFDVLLNANQWLIHGSLIPDDRSQASNKRVPKQHSMDALLILNSREPVIKESIMNGFNKLIESFSSGAKAIFEIDFETIIKAFYTHQLLNAINRDDAKKVDLAACMESLGDFKKINSSVVFATNSASSTYDNFSHYPNRIGYDRATQSATKFGGLISRIRSAISNKASKFSAELDPNSEFLSLDGFPCIFYYLDKEKNKLLYYSHVNPIQSKISNDEDFSSDIGGRYRRGETIKLEDLNLKNSSRLIIEPGANDKKDPYESEGDLTREKTYENLQSKPRITRMFKKNSQENSQTNLLAEKSTTCINQAKSASKDILDYGFAEKYITQPNQQPLQQNVRSVPSTKYHMIANNISTDSSGSTLFRPSQQSIDKWQKQILTINSRRNQMRAEKIPEHEQSTQTTQAMSASEVQMALASTSSSEEIADLDDNADLFKCFTNIVDDNSSRVMDQPDSQPENGSFLNIKSAYSSNSNHQVIEITERKAGYGFFNSTGCENMIFKDESCRPAYHGDCKNGSATCSSYSTSPSTCVDSACESCDSSSNSCVLCKMASRSSSTSGTSSNSASLSKTSSTCSSSPNKVASQTSSFSQSTSLSSFQLLDCSKVQNNGNCKRYICQASNKLKQQTSKLNYNCCISADDINADDLFPRDYTDKDQLIEDTKRTRPSILNNNYEKSKSVDLVNRIKSHQRPKVAFILDKDITKRNTILNGIKKTIAMKDARYDAHRNTSRRLDNRTYSIEHTLNRNDPTAEKYNRAKNFFENLDRQTAGPLTIKLPPQSNLNSASQVNDPSKNKKVFFDNANRADERKFPEGPNAWEIKYATNRQNRMFISQKSSAAEARSTTYTRCYAKISPRARKPMSPPPKSQIQPNGLLPPPLPARLPPNVASLLRGPTANSQLNHSYFAKNPKLPQQDTAPLPKSSNNYVPEYHKYASNAAKDYYSSAPNAQYPTSAHSKPGMPLKQPYEPRFNTRENTTRPMPKNEYERFPTATVSKNVPPVVQTYLKAVQEKQEKCPIGFNSAQNPATKNSNFHEAPPSAIKSTSNMDRFQLHSESRANFKSGNSNSRMNPNAYRTVNESSAPAQNGFNAYATQNNYGKMMQLKMSGHQSRSNVSLDLIDFNEDLSKPVHPYQSHYAYQSAAQQTSKQVFRNPRPNEHDQYRYKPALMTVKQQASGPSRPALNQMKSSGYHQGMLISGY